MRITGKHLKKVYDHFEIDPKDIPYRVMRAGLKVELEHGTIGGPMTNITDDNIIMTAQIVLAHLKEGIGYYDFLALNEKMMERLREGTSCADLVETLIVLIKTRKLGRVPRLFKYKCRETCGF